MQDVLAICGGALPSWCSQLVVSCKFLFPFDIRRRYFYCTAFGLARALHHLQQLQNAEGGNAPNTDRQVRELRLGRLQRQKVSLPTPGLAASDSIPLFVFMCPPRHMQMSGTTVHLSPCCMLILHHHHTAAGHWQWCNMPHVMLHRCGCLARTCCCRQRR